VPRQKYEVGTLAVDGHSPPGHLAVLHCVQKKTGPTLTTRSLYHS